MFNNNTFGATAFYAAPVDENSEEEVSTNFVTAKLEYTLNSRLKLESRQSYRTNKDIYTLNADNPSLFQNEHNSQYYQSDLQVTSIHGRYGQHQVAGGLSYQYGDLSSNNLGQRNYYNIGAFVEADFELVKGFHLSPGVYFCQNRSYLFSNPGHTFLR